MTELPKNRKRWKGNIEVQTVTQLVVLKWGKTALSNLMKVIIMRDFEDLY